MVTPSDYSRPRKRAGMHEKGGRENEQMSNDYSCQTKAKPLNSLSNKLKFNAF